MYEIHHLPNFSIDPTAGPLSSILFEKGFATFFEACRWVKNLPYGPNNDEYDSAALIVEKRGTCTAKHGLIAKLAFEHNVPVYWVFGCYRLTEAILPGISALLKKYRLTFLPQIHCLLEYRLAYVDLTEGNCSGKKALPENYDLLLRVGIGINKDHERRLYRWILHYYRMLDIAALQRVPEETFLHARREARDLWLCHLNDRDDHLCRHGLAKEELQPKPMIADANESLIKG